LGKLNDGQGIKKGRDVHPIFLNQGRGVKGEAKVKSIAKEQKKRLGKGNQKQAPV